ncbi:hypothetical protein B7494_g7507 [Chlorociboria aeruginascens]|nr:hypothetical protein B7494_g7507 [Chlorociboria aeruginascens]
MKIRSKAEQRSRKMTEDVIRWNANSKKKSNHDEEPSQESHLRKAAQAPQKSKRGRPRKSVPQMPTIPSDDDLSSEDEQVIHQARKVKPGEILAALKLAAERLSSLGTSEDVQKWLKEHGFEDCEDLKDLQEHCSSINKLLRTRFPSPTKVVTIKKSPGILEALIQNQYFVFRGPGQVVMVLAPVEIYRGTANLSAKTFGFVQERGGFVPRMCAVSGYTDNVEAHEKVLDSEYWTQQVLLFGLSHRYAFRSGPFDNRQKVPSGTEFASHVEKKLMLFWAMRLLMKFCKSDCVGMLPQLCRIKSSDKEVDLFIAGVSEYMCDCCSEFQKRLEEVTGIKYTVHVIPNLAKLEADVDERTNRKLFRVPSMGVEGPMRMEVIIQNKISQSRVVSNSVRDRSLQKASSRAAASRKRRVDWEEDSGSEYELPSSSTTIEVYTPERKWARAPDISSNDTSTRGSRKKSAHEWWW